MAEIRNAPQGAALETIDYERLTRVPFNGEIIRPMKPGAERADTVHWSEADKRREAKLQAQHAAGELTEDMAKAAMQFELAQKVQ